MKDDTGRNLTRGKDGFGQGLERRQGKGGVHGIIWERRAKPGSLDPKLILQQLQQEDF